MVIWKQQLSVVDVQTIYIPRGAEILSVANQDGLLCMWFVCDPDGQPTKRTIEIIGTGHRFEANSTSLTRKFIGTAIIGPFAWHVFEQLAE